MAIKRTPDKLGTKAARFWRETTKTYDLSPAELLILEGACREVDIIERCEKELDGADLVTSGSMGQDVAHPLLAEVRQHRAAFGSMVKQLALPDAEEQPTSAASRQAQAAANARWSRGA